MLFRLTMDQLQTADIVLGPPQVTIITEKRTKPTTVLTLALVLSNSLQNVHSRLSTKFTKIFATGRSLLLLCL